MNRIYSVLKTEPTGNIKAEGRYEYDKYGKLTYAYTPESGTGEYSYDATGNITDVKFHLRTWADTPLLRTEYGTYTSTCY